MTTTPSPADPAEKTIGQIAYEAGVTQLYLGVKVPSYMAWSECTQGHIKVWERGAKSVADHVSAPLLQRIAELEKENKILSLKNSTSLANNLCPDHRDKQSGNSCLACEVERLSDGHVNGILEKFDGDFWTVARPMIVCKKCGNKRCPHAENQEFRCTESNAVGQVGERSS